MAARRLGVPFLFLGRERRGEFNAEFAEDAEGAEKSEEKRVCIVRSSEPTYRKRRERWGTLKFNRWVGRENEENGARLRRRPLHRQEKGQEGGASPSPTKLGGAT